MRNQRRGDPVGEVEHFNEDVAEKTFFLVWNILQIFYNNVSPNFI